MQRRAGALPSSACSWRHLWLLAGNLQCGCGYWWAPAPRACALGHACFLSLGIMMVAMHARAAELGNRFLLAVASANLTFVLCLCSLRVGAPCCCRPVFPSLLTTCNFWQQLLLQRFAMAVHVHTVAQLVHMVLDHFHCVCHHCCLHCAASCWLHSHQALGYHCHRLRMVPRWVVTGQCMHRHAGAQALVSMQRRSSRVRPGVSAQTTRIGH